MSTQHKTNDYSVFFLLFFFCIGISGVLFGQTVEIKDDDGVSDYPFTCIYQPEDAAKKVLILDEQPQAGDKVAIKYFIDHNDGLAKAREIPEMIIKVNDREACRRKVNKNDFSTGWHILEIGADLLHKGENSIIFELGKYDPSGGAVAVYFGLDTGNSQGRSYIRRKSAGSWAGCDNSGGDKAELMIRLLISRGAAGADNSGGKNTLVPYVKGKIIIDGNVTKEKWQNALMLKDFYDMKKKALAENQTEVFLQCDDDNLYVGIICYARDPSKLVANAAERDGKIYRDDSVEMFLDIKETKKSYCHYIINPRGAYYDSYLIEPFMHNPEWNGNAEIKALIGSDRWQAEMRIPYADLLGEHYRDFTGEKKFGFNVVRNDKIDDKMSSWAILAGTAVHVPSQFIGFTTDKNIPKGAKISFADLKGGGGQRGGAIARVWQVKNPVFAEVIGSEPRRHKEIAGIIWNSVFYEWTPSVCRNLIALQAGLEMKKEYFLGEHSRLKLAVVDGWHMFLKKGTKPYKEARQYGLKIMFKDSIMDWDWFLYNSGKLDLEEVIDMDHNKKIADALKSGCQTIIENNDVVWGTFHDDETLDNFFDNFWKKIYENESKDKIDKIIKETCGFGRFGVPLKDNPDPLCCIAVNRYLANRAVEIYKRAYLAQKKAKPDLVVMSTTHRGGWHTCFSLSRLADWCDAVSQQSCSDLNPDRQYFAFQAKYLKDLSDKKLTYPCLHLENYQASFNAEETVENMSQAFRGGVDSILYFTPDCVADSGINYTRFDYYGDIERWQAVLHVFGIIKNMNRLKFPEADTAIFVSTDTEMSKVVNFSSQVYFERFHQPLFTVLGPRIGSWFDFIEDNQIEDGKIDPAKYKIIYIPNAKYERAIVTEKLIEYVKKGGLLVVFDPETFRYDVNGDDRINDLSGWYGISYGRPGNIEKSKLVFKDRAPGKEGIIRKLIRKFMLKYIKLEKDIELGKGIEGGGIAAANLTGIEVKPEKATVIAMFEDGQPAIVQNKLGKGRILLFTHNPAVTLESAQWDKLIKNLQVSAGCSIGEKIWRFKFPLSPYKRPVETLKCLTGNYFEWILNEAKDLYNAEIDGYYTYSAPPDQIRENMEGNIPFKKGKLLNRKETAVKVSVCAGPEEKRTKISDWVVSWKDISPVSITFTFAKAVTPRRVRIFYEGELPDYKVLLSDDNKTFHEAGMFKGNTSDPLDVLCSKAEFDGKSCTSVRLDLGKRSAELIISEIDIWGDL